MASSTSNPLNLIPILLDASNYIPWRYQINFYNLLRYVGALIPCPDKFFRDETGKVVTESPEYPKWIAWDKKKLFTLIDGTNVLNLKIEL